MINYVDLPRRDRRAATKLAKRLLRTVPAAQEGEEARSIRGALHTAFMRPENVVGALVYTDGNGNWWGDVALKKGRKCLQIGTPVEAPQQSCDEALELVKTTIARIKATREHPLVQEFRDKGFDPEQVELLRVRHEGFGVRWMLLEDHQISTGAEVFAAYVEENFSIMADKLEQARTIIIQMAPQFATDTTFLTLVDDQAAEEREFRLLCCAAAFLLRCGIVNIDQDAAEAMDNRGTMSPQRTVH